MFGNFFNKRDKFRNFYERETDLLASGSDIGHKLYTLRQMLEAEQEEVNSADDEKMPSPYWMFYYWVGDALTILDNYGGHPFQPKDESYNGRSLKASVKSLRKMETAFDEIKDYVKQRGSKKAEKIVAALDDLEIELNKKVDNCS